MNITVSFLLVIVEKKRASVFIYPMQRYRSFRGKKKYHLITKRLGVTINILKRIQSTEGV